MDSPQSLNQQESKTPNFILSLAGRDQQLGLKIWSLQEEILAVAMAELSHAPDSSSDSEEEFFDASFFVDER